MLNRAEQRIAELEKQLAQAKSERRKEIYEQMSQLEQENQKLRAQCAVMREALEESLAALLVGYSMDCGFKECYSRTGISNHSRCGAHESIINAWFKIKNALSITAERDLLEGGGIELNTNGFRSVLYSAYEKLQTQRDELRAQCEAMRERVKELQDDRNLEKKMRKDAEDRCTALEERIKNLERLIAPAKNAAKCMEWWLEDELCDCEDGNHICGLPARRRELRWLQETLADLEKIYVITEPEVIIVDNPDEGVPE